MIDQESLDGLTEEECEGVVVLSAENVKVGPFWRARHWDTKWLRPPE